MDNNKKILIITYNYEPFNTPGVFRIIGFVNYLSDFGFTPCVLTVSNPREANYDEGLSHFVYRTVPVYKTKRFNMFEQGLRWGSSILKRSNKTKEGASGDVLSGRGAESKKSRLKSAAKVLMSCLNVPDPDIWWLPGGLISAWRLVRKQRIEYILTSSPPHSTQLFGIVLKILRPRLIWISDYRDPWMDNSLRQSKAKLLEHIERWLEREALQNADLVVANTEMNRDRLLNRHKFLRKDRVKVITNGFDVRDFVEATVGTVQRRPGRKIFTHVGSLYPGMIDSVIRACLTLKAEDPMISSRLEVLFVGYFDQDDRELVKRSGLDDLIFFIGEVSYKRSLEFMAVADALICLLPIDKDMTYCIPSKLFNYIAIGKPILAIIPQGCAADIIRELNFGYVLDPKATEVIAQYFKYVLKNEETLMRTEFGACLVEKYKKRNLVARLASEITAVAGCRRGVI